MSKLRHFKIFIPLFILVIFTSFSLLFPKKAFAFQEEFDGNSLNSSLWQSYENGGRISLSSGSIELSSGAGTFPYIYAKQNPFPENGDFSLQLKIQYTFISSRGAGVTIGNLLPPNNITDNYWTQNDQNVFLFNIWQDSVNHFNISYRSCQTNDICDSQRNFILKLENNNTDYNIINIDYKNNKYYVFFNEGLVFTSSETLRRPSTLWIGNPVNHNSSYNWSSFKIDYILIGPYINPYPTPTPTPTPTPLQPVVLLPGLGASWNHEKIILGIDKPQSDWYMTPGIKVYDGLIETFKNAGYKTEGENKNLFVFNYDWTKNVDLISEDLKNYIQNVVRPPSGAKIDLVGHSLGGLVAKTYVQKNQNNPVDQLLTLGSPLKGVPSVYYLWEGGNLNKSLSGWQRIGAGLLLHLRKPGFSTTMEAARTVIPSLKDLLPTFNYLKQNSQEKPLEQMSQKNDWLINLNNSLPDYLLSISNHLLGVLPNSTIRWFNVVQPSWIEQLLGLWQDGKPQSEEYDAGDQTVLAESANLNGAKVFSLENMNHTDLVTSTTAQQKIMEILGLSPSSISTIAAEIVYEPSLVFQLASPAVISEIMAPDGHPTGFTDGKLAIIPNAVQGEYQVKITGTGNGNYHLYIGQILKDQDFWTDTSGSIENGEQVNYKISFNPSSPEKDPLIDSDNQTHLKSAKTKISELKDYLNQENISYPIKKALLANLKNILRFLGKGEIEKSIFSLYHLHYQINLWPLNNKLEKPDSLYLKNTIQEIIEELEEAYVLAETSKGKEYNQKRLNQEIKLATQNFQRMETKLQTLNEKGKAKQDYGVLYSLALEKLNQAKKSISYEAHIKVLGAFFLSQEGLIFFR